MVAQLPERRAAVTDGGLLCSVELGQRAAERREEEDRVVAEAVLTARLVVDAALDRAPRLVEDGGAIRNGEGADESRRASQRAARTQAG